MDSSTNINLMTPGDLYEKLTTAGLSAMTGRQRQGLALLRYAGVLSLSQSWKAGLETPIAELGRAYSSGNFWGDPCTNHWQEELQAALDPAGQFRSLYPELYLDLLQNALSTPLPTEKLYTIGH